MIHKFVAKINSLARCYLKGKKRKKKMSAYVSVKKITKLGNMMQF